MVLVVVVGLVRVVVEGEAFLNCLSENSLDKSKGHEAFRFIMLFILCLLLVVMVVVGLVLIVVGVVAIVIVVVHVIDDVAVV